MSAERARFGPPAPFEPPAWVADRLGRPTGKGILVGVIDSGWDRACDDPRVLPGIGLVDPADDLAMLRTDDDDDRVGHGTACIHQILRIAPDARVVPIRVFGKQLETSPPTLEAGILYAMERGVDVVNLSLGTMLKGALNRLYLACEIARQKGIIIVAAGHNSQRWSYPAVFENVIGVSAGLFGSPYDFRYHVDEAMECEAWGVAQPVVGLGGEQQIKHGTSFAAPNITGIVCLLLERHPGASLERVRAMLVEHATAVVQPGEAKVAKAEAKAKRARAKAKAARAKAKVANARAKVAQAKAELAEAKLRLARAQAKVAKAEKAKAEKAKAKAKPGPSQAQPVKAAPVALVPPETQPSGTAPVEVQPAGAQPAETQPPTAAPVEAELQAQSADVDPSGPQPAEAEAVAAEPAEAQPARAEQVEVEPAEARAAADPFEPGATESGTRTSDAPEDALSSVPGEAR